MRTRSDTGFALTDDRTRLSGWWAVRKAAKKEKVVPPATVAARTDAVRPHADPKRYWRRLVALARHPILHARDQ